MFKLTKLRVFFKNRRCFKFILFWRFSNKSIKYLNVSNKFTDFYLTFSVSPAMCKIKVDFDFIARVLTSLGFGSYKKNRKRKFLAILLFLLVFPVHVTFLILLMARTSSMLDRARIIQTIPLMISVIIGAVNIKWKFPEIEKLLRTISEMTTRIKSQKILLEMRTEKYKIIKFFSLLCFLSAFGTQVASLILNKTFLLTWEPEIFADHKKLTFLINWILETIKVVYGVCLSLFMNFFHLFLLLSLKGFAKHLSEDIGSLNTSREKLEVLKRLEQFHELRKWVQFQVKNVKPFKLYFAELWKAFQVFSGRQFYLRL